VASKAANVQAPSLLKSAMVDADLVTLPLTMMLPASFVARHQLPLLQVVLTMATLVPAPVVMVEPLAVANPPELNSLLVLAPTMVNVPLAVADSTAANVQAPSLLRSAMVDVDLVTPPPTTMLPASFVARPKVGSIHFWFNPTYHYLPLDDIPSSSS
jgi:hypothetical protein